MAPRQCLSCGGYSFVPTGGSIVCEGCGNVVEENTIVAEVGFSETSSGAVIAQGKSVAAGADRAGGFGAESRQQAIENGKTKIREIAAVMGLGSQVVSRAYRLYNIVVSNNFNKGRSALRVAAVCLYVVCRQMKNSLMLIDFSDILRVNVFELGATYTRMRETIPLGDDPIPIIDPSQYIRRFASLLEFGDDLERVVTDASRLVKRFNADWMDTGRRPAGVCGAAILLAARMNNFRRSIEEIVQVVKIADSTIIKRLEEFKNTPSGSLTVEQFRNMWLNEAVDPPAFTKGLEKRLRESEARAVGMGTLGEDEENEADDEDHDDVETRPAKKRRKGGRVGSRQLSSTPAPGADVGASPRAATPVKHGRLVSITSPEPDPSAHNPDAEPSDELAPAHQAFVETNAQALSALEATPDPSSQPQSPVGQYFEENFDELDVQAPGDDEEEAEFYQKLREELEETVHAKEGVAEEYARDRATEATEATRKSEGSQAPVLSGTTLVIDPSLRESAQPREGSVQPDAVEEEVDEGELGRLVEAANDQSEPAAPPAEADDNLDDVDDDEISRYICTPEEAERKARIWVEFNREYLEAKASQDINDISGIKPPKKRSKPQKPKDSSNPAASSTVEAAAMVLKKKAISRRIKYDKLATVYDTDNEGVSRKDNKKKDKDKSKNKKSSGQENRDRRGLSASGLIRMEASEDESMAWANSDKRSESAMFDGMGGDDGYGSDDYQQEA